LDRVKEKTVEEKIQCDPVIQLKTQLQPVDFCFLLKQRHFDFLKNN
jgi:hypothetical protein